MPTINQVTDLTIDGDIAVVTLDSPPVNALSAVVRDGLHEAFTPGDRRRRGASDRVDLRRADVHRRGRHLRIRRRVGREPACPRCSR